MIRRFFKFIRNRLGKASGVNQERSETTNVVTASDSGQNSTARSAPQKKKRRRRPKKNQPGEQLVAPETVIPLEPWNPENFQVIPAEGKTRFHDFSLPDEIMHAIADLGFSYCTPIQAESLVPTLNGQDVIGQAQTGTGKTAAFLIAIFARILANRGEKRKTGSPTALVLAPTRELVIQIAEDGEALGRYAGITIAPVYGGIDYQKQQNRLLGKAVDLVVATPGRLLDFQRNRILDLSEVNTLVIDEADRMLDMGFIPDVRKIVQTTLPKERRQTLMFSATITPDVSHLAAQWTRKPVTVSVAPEQVAVDTVKQVVYLTTAADKYKLLYNTLIDGDLQRVMVFTNRKDETRKLTERLKRNDISCAMLSGDVPQSKRIKTLEDFKNGRIRVLVATDVAGRGIHIDGVSHVVNYTLPYDPEDYVHRIGRTGRAGSSGISVSFACEEGSFYIPEIEAYLGAKLPCTTPDPELLKEPPKGTIRPEEKIYPGKPPGRGRSRRPAPSGHRKTSRPRPVAGK
ncbi:MAG: DEAD/DEAH box helicase [Proteobacteria bacterium]|nr:DEAD/DEAH box helicase [Pseudomonadota bacterium]MBU1737948.1 DEAD/DEAH box helicase [Pseudomonadota bacterium]